MDKKPEIDEDELPDQTVSQEAIRAAQKAAAAEAASVLPLCPGCGEPIHEGDCGE